jgi:hypothetical protein
MWFIQESMHGRGKEGMNRKPRNSIPARKGSGVGISVPASGQTSESLVSPGILSSHMGQQDL